MYFKLLRQKSRYQKWSVEFSISAIVFVTLGVVTIVALTAHKITEFSNMIQTALAAGVGTFHEFFVPSPSAWW